MPLWKFVQLYKYAENDKSGGTNQILSEQWKMGADELLEALGMDMEFLEVIQFAACDKVDFEIKIKK